MTGPHSVGRRPPTRSHIYDLGTSQKSKAGLLTALNQLFDGPPKVKQDIKNDLSRMTNKLNEYFFTETPVSNEEIIDIINQLLNDERYQNIELPHPNGHTITLSLSDALNHPLPAKNNFDTWDETKALILPEDTDAEKAKKHKYAKQMAKKIVLYLRNAPPRTLGGRRTRKQRKNKSQRRTRRARKE
jgi:hypothetical protein